MPLLCSAVARSQRRARTFDDVGNRAATTRDKKRDAADVVRRYHRRARERPNERILGSI